jgi:hypothetical protein
LRYLEWQSLVTQAIYMRTDQPPFNDVRVRRAISHAIDRQALIEAVWGRGEPTPAVSRGLVEWSLPIEQLGPGAKYYQYDPKEAKRLLAEAGYPKGFKTPLIVSSGYGRDLLDEGRPRDGGDVQVGKRAKNDHSLKAVDMRACLGEINAFNACAGLLLRRKSTLALSDLFKTRGRPGQMMQPYR